MSINKMCIIADGYPSEHRVVNAFVETLVNELTDSGVECCVIAPQSFTRYLKKNIEPLPYKRDRITSKGNKVPVYSPKYLSASTTKVLGVNTSYITLSNFRHAAMKCFGKLSKIAKFDAVYGHFIFESGITSNAIGKKYGIPAFFAYGENTTYSIDYLGEAKTKKLLEGVKGVVAVSSENKRVLLSKNLASEKNIEVFPNAVDTSLFYSMDKTAMRAKYGFPQDAFIVAFTGRFLEVKGPNRLSQALDSFNNVYSVFIGDGPLGPTCKNVLFKGTASHESLGELLSTADIFVLPTLAEGCCNAIIEALACGLPVVSSNRPFNDDILNDECSIRIDPEKIEDIGNAIEKLKSNPELVLKMSNAALLKAQDLTIEKRAKRILAFLNSKVETEENDS